MAANAMQEAVRAVLAAVNLDPVDFELDPGFLQRARRSGQPRAIALSQGGVSIQFIYVGAVESGDLEAQAHAACTRALAWLPEAARQSSERLIVGWHGQEGASLAAVFVVGAGPDRLEPVAYSWRAPHDWPTPMIDATRTREQALDDALRRLGELVASNRDERSNFEDAFERAVKVIDIALKRLGGEPLSAEGHPYPHAPQSSWDHWLDRYVRSVRDEARRAASRPSSPTPAPVARNGPLAGKRVFLSYAKPDAATLAWPVRDALHSRGARVWLDQEQTLDTNLLDKGLAEAIAGCDVYVMCASDEFLERAGYATQELVWALQYRETGGGPRRFIVAALPGTLLPTLLSDWPVVIVADGGHERLADDLVQCLQIPASTPTRGLPAPSAPGRSATLPPLDARADLPLARLRAAHSKRFADINPEDVMRLIAQRNAARDAAKIRRQLLTLAQGLDWSGRLVDMDRWPADPLVRDMRFRLASLRIEAAVSWPLDGNFANDSELEEDLRVLVMEQVPIRSWPNAPGWAEDERRFALRWHAGLLRALQELFRQDMAFGLPDLPAERRHHWMQQLTARRLECLDSLLSLRLEGRIGWTTDPPTWGTLFSSWSKVLEKPGTGWNPALPSEVRQELTVNLTELAAVAAQQAWQVAHHAGHSSQSFPLLALPRDGVAVAFASVDGTTCPAPESDSPALALGLVGGRAGGAELTLAWRAADLGSGVATAAAPDQLCRALAWATASN